MTVPSGLIWCELCGQAADLDVHGWCRQQEELEPPRWCGQCRRRMVVQVTPSGWTARCSEHGLRNSPPGNETS